VSLWWEIPGLVTFACASFFFALTETALFALSKWQLHQLPERVPARGALVARLLQQPHDLLATIVLGNTLSNAGLIAITLWTTLNLGLPRSLELATASALFLVILLGCEVFPKTLAVRAPERWSLRVAVPMSLLLRLSRPLRHITQTLNSFILHLLARGDETTRQTLSDDEYRELLELASQRGSIAVSEKEIISQIIRLDRRTAGDVMKPRSQMACIPDDLPVEAMIDAARRFQHRRLPLYDETPDTIVGLLNTRTLLLDPGVDLADAIEFPSFVPESSNLLQLLSSLQRQHRGMAIVLDEFGTTAGLITIEDILEQIIGPIRSVDEEQGFVMEKLDHNRWRVSGSMRLDDFRREYPDLGDVPEVDTMGGLLTACLEVVPAPGDTTVFRGLRLTATAADERRVRELLVERVPKGAR
jgi:CBS domain containing-hemolysin-like protein